jgi:hypothetical protein
MGFNSRFTTKPAVKKPSVARPFVTKPSASSVDEYEVEEQTLLRSSDRSRQSEAPSADDSRFSSPKTPRLGKEEISVVAAGAVLLLLFSALPEALPLGVIGRSTNLLGTVL